MCSNPQGKEALATGPQQLSGVAMPPCCRDGTLHPGESEGPVPTVQLGESDNFVPATSGRLELSLPKGPKVDLSLNTLRWPSSPPLACMAWPLKA